MSGASTPVPERAQQCPPRCWQRHGRVWSGVLGRALATVGSWEGVSLLMRCCLMPARVHRPAVCECSPLVLSPCGGGGTRQVSDCAKLGRDVVIVVIIFGL